LARRRLMASRHTSKSIGVVVLICLVSLFFSAWLAQFPYANSLQSDTTILAMNFHMRLLVYGNSNGSMFVYNGADGNPPTFATPATTLVSCNIRQSLGTWFLGMDGWFGGVAWITQPLAENMTILGNANMTVWMSTPDSAPLASGYAFGISEVDSLGNPVGEFIYNYRYVNGSVLGSSPAPFELSFNVDRTFVKGNIIGFFALVGSTTEAWHYQVYFDSLGINSFASLPIVAVPIPEFWQTSGIAIACLALATWLMSCHKRRSQ